MHASQISRIELQTTLRIIISLDISTKLKTKTEKWNTLKNNNSESKAASKYLDDNYV